MLLIFLVKKPAATQVSFDAPTEGPSLVITGGLLPKTRRGLMMLQASK